MHLPFLLSLAPALPAQNPLTELSGVSDRNVGIHALQSSDGQVLYHARGSRVHELDLAAMRGLGAPPPQYDWESVATGSTWFVDRTTTAMVESGDLLGTTPTNGREFLWIGSEGSLVRIDRASGVVGTGAFDIDTNGRWVFDLAYVPGATVNDPDYVFAALAGEGVNALLRVDANAGTTTEWCLACSGLFGEPRAYGLAIDEGDPTQVFVALGESGVVRVDTTQTPGACDPTPLCSSFDLIWSPQGIAHPTYVSPSIRRARDVAIAGGELFIAAEALGLVRIDLSQVGGTITPDYLTLDGSGSASCATAQQFAIRVDAIAEPVQQQNVVMVGTNARPSLLHEWGNYAHYGNFDHDLAPLGLTDLTAAEITHFSHPSSGLPDDSNTMTFVVSDPGTTTFEERGCLSFGGGRGVMSMRSVDLRFHADDQGLWTVDNQPALYFFENDPLGPVVASSRDTYFAEHADHTLSIQSRMDPKLILSGQDGRTRGLYAVDTSSGDAELSLSPNTEQDDYYIGLFCQETWLDGQTIESEWGGVANTFPASDGGSSFGLIRFRSSGGTISSWNWWHQDFPADPFMTIFTPSTTADDLGRGYRTITSRYGVGPNGDDDILALHRNGVVNTVTIYRPSELMTAAASLADAENLGVTARNHLCVHEEMGGFSQPPASMKLPAGRSRMVELSEIGTSFPARLVLGVAAGSRVEETPSNEADLREPKVVIFDLTDCRDGGLCDARIDDSTKLGTTVAGTRRVLLGSPTGHDALAFGVEVTRINGATIVFSANTDGSVSAWDATDAFDPLATTPLIEAARWTMADAVLDAAPTALVDVVHRREELRAGGGLRDILYLAASRRGVIRLRVDVSGTPGSSTIAFTYLGTLPTPGQPSGISMGQLDFGSGTPSDVMIVSDHSSAGVRVYVEEPGG